MPELPEVETVKSIIAPQIRGRIVLDIKMNRPEIVSHPSADEFYKSVKGREIKGMGRRGKFLYMVLDTGDMVLLHLRMTGHLLVTPPDFPLQKHTHMIFYLDNGKELRFDDSRRFGRFWLIKTDEEDTYSGINKLGLEPFDPRFTGHYLKEKLRKRSKPIKECLLEQSIVTGIGNIYADEILFAIKLNPKRSASSLNDDEWDRLAYAIPSTLHEAIVAKKTTPEEYLAKKGRGYRENPFLKVYGFGGKPCVRCHTTLEKIVLGGRSCVFCPKCQK